MPAILTHDFFGRDTLSAVQPFIGSSADERNTFLLGNQGPDPLFYSVADPLRRRIFRLGQLLHNEEPTMFLVALHDAVARLDEADRPIGEAYALGFICHHLLDSRMHPFVFAQQDAFCHAGVEGLTQADHNEVHATIESSLDEEVLFAKSGETVATYNPCEHVLIADDRVLDVVSDLYAAAIERTYGISVPADTYRLSMRCFRRMQRFLYSPTGQKREIAGAIESSFHRYSLMRAMSHRPVACTDSPFDNHEHAPWARPADGAIFRTGFWDIYTQAAEAAEPAFDVFAAKRLPFERALAITKGNNFEGVPVD